MLGWSTKNNYDNWEAVKVLVPSISPVDTAEDIAAQLEQSVKMVDIARKKEEKKQWDLQQLQRQEEKKKQSDL